MKKSSDMAGSKAVNVASFFSGCGGFDLGFEKAGFNMAIASDFWEPAANTFRLNFPNTEFIFEDIKNLTKTKLLKVLKNKNINKIHVIIGGPPCQCFTRLNNNNLRKDDERNQLFRDYIKMINFLKPDFVVMENVADLRFRKKVQDLLDKGKAKTGRDYFIVAMVFQHGFTLSSSKKAIKYAKKGI